MQLLRTLAQPLRHEIDKIKGSRFLATARPVASAEVAMAFVEEMRGEFRDATHNCWAWRLAPGEDLFRYSDDGEPSGTAGRPILQEIDGRRLQNVALVVTRYYGGTKLGTGGLLRAYGRAAAEALDLAELLETPVVRSLQLAFAYDLTGAVQGVLAAFRLEPTAADYGAQVQMRLDVPVDQADSLTHQLTEATAGRLQVKG